jgi:site-specific DNA recombinase
MTTRARIYVRISYATDGSVLGVERQEPPCRQLTARKGWEVAGVYTDNDLSAYSGRHRPAYQQLLDDTTGDLAAGQDAAIVAWDADRLTRQPTENEALIELAERRGVQLATVTGEYDLATAGGRLHFRIKGAIARHESEHKAERIKLWHGQRAQAGEWHGGRRPFGYRYAPGGGLELDEPEAAAIREAAVRILGGGTLTAIAREWRARGLMATESGRPVTVTRVDRILRSPHLAGVRVHQGELYPAAWPPIVDHQTQVAVVAILDARGGELRHRSRTLLAGMLVCGCGHKMFGATLKGKGGRRQPGYRCDASSGGCGRTHRLAGPIDDFVRDAVIEAHLSRKLTASIGREQELDTDPTMLAARLDADRRKLAALRLLEDDLDDYAERAAAVEARIAQARRALAASTSKRVLDGLPATKAALERAWAGWGTDRRREVVAAAVNRITVRPIGRGVRFDGRRHLEIDWRI